MFNKPLSAITLDDVQAFCKEWPEGIRVEYKRQLIDNIPKTVSAFANTLGGFLIMGVVTDSATSKAIFPIEGMDRQPGLEERIAQSALTGIYPSVLPEIKVLEVNSDGSKIITVVKVDESSEAPHAIQNSKRIYVRTGNISSPYDLAELDRIEFLLRQRQKAEQFRSLLGGKSEIRFKDYVSQQLRNEPYITIEIGRPYPYKQILTPEAVYEFVRRKRLSNEPFEEFIDNPKRIPNGVFCAERGNRFPVSELNSYGFVVTRSQFYLAKASWEPNTGRLFIRAPEIIWTIGKSLKLADQFFKWANFSADLTIGVTVKNSLNRALQVSRDEHEDSIYVCSDREFSVHDNISSADLSANVVQVVARVSKEAFWAFNFWRGNLEPWVTEVLKQNHLL